MTLIEEIEMAIANVLAMQPMDSAEFERRKALPNVSQFDELTSPPRKPCNPP